MSKLKESYIAVFAHFDKDNLIDDYVVEYLQELKKVAEKIIFVSDCNIIDSIFPYPGPLLFLLLRSFS